VGLVAAALAAIAILRGHRDGRAFAAFLATYATGRFAIEFLRGDPGRGAALSLSTAQWVSLAIVATLTAFLLARPFRTSSHSRAIEGRVQPAPHATPPPSMVPHGPRPTDAQSKSCHAPS